MSIRVCVAALLCAGATGAAAAGLEAPASSLLVRADQQLAEPVEARGAEVSAQVRELEALFRSLPSDSMQRLKAERLLALARSRAEQPGLVPTESLPRPVPFALQSPDQAARCESALRLGPGAAIAVEVSPEHPVWLRVDAPPGQDLRLSTRGSRIDARLSAFLDCRVQADPPFLSADDSYGLQADLALSQEHTGQTFWLVKLENLSELAGEAVVSTTDAIVVTGTVLSALDSTPAVGREILTYRRIGSSINYQSAAYVDNEGRFSIALAEAGEYAFRTSLYFQSGNASLMDEAWENAYCLDRYYRDISHCGDASNSVSWSSLAFGSSTALHFRLEQASVMAGTVATAGTGQPLENAEAILFNHLGEPIRSERVDAAGRFMIPGLVPGRYFLVAGAYGYQYGLYDGAPCRTSYNAYDCDVLQGTPIELGAQETRRIDVRLVPRPSVLVDLFADGQPLANAMNTIELLNMNGVVVRQSESYGSRLDISDVEPGTYYLRARSRATLSGLYPDVVCASDCLAELGQASVITVVADTPGLEIVMELQSYPSLSGRVTDEASGAAIAEAALELWKAGSGVYYVSTSASDGSYRFPAVPPGSYALRARRNGYITELHSDIACLGAPLTECGAVNLLQFTAAGNDQVVDVDLSPAARVSGKLEWVDGRPVQAYTSLHLVAADGRELYRVDVNLDGQGRYFAENLPSGSYRIAAARSGGEVQLYPFVNCRLVWYNDFSECDLSSATPVDLSSGVTVDGIDFRLIPQHARAVKAVGFETGLPLPGVAIDLWDLQGRRINTGVTGADGLAYPEHGYYSTDMSGYVSTFNTQGLEEQVYQDRACPQGSVFFNLCSLQGATAVPFTVPLDSEPLLFRMRSGDPTVFDSGFEP